MLNREIIIKRLALIKYLYRQGIEQSKQFETLAAFSILSFHDSVEMFLKLAAEHLDISDKYHFMEYWNHIPNLTLKESMKNLNLRRVSIKHKGILPSKSDIEVSRVNTTDFFEQNTIKQFGIEFSEISLLNLITFKKVKSHLVKAESALEKNDIKTCSEETAIAFSELLNDYEKSKSSYFSSPFYSGYLRAVKSFYSDLRVSSDKLTNDDRKLATFVDNVGKSIEEITSAIKIISYGIDYKRYMKFDLLTPSFIRSWDGHYFFKEFEWEERKLTKENGQYCIDFVVESTLTMQEFNFDINEVLKIEDRETLSKLNNIRDID